MATQIIQCPIPSNEAERLSAVWAYDILDSQPEVDFDTLTRLAVSVLNPHSGLSVANGSPTTIDSTEMVT